MKPFLVAAVVVLVAFLTLLPVGQGQDVQHAPTVAQCQADQRFWDSKLTAEDAKDWAHSVNDVSAQTLLFWWSEMVACLAVDPNNLSDYAQTERHILLVRGSRMNDFIRRHGLMDKFNEEDAAGKR